ncbi:MAG: beta-lactamase family protein [Caldilineaceae bacterium]|nr:beta-lactamase family protein [Caldilineaceae bacterium]
MTSRFETQATFDAFCEELQAACAEYAVPGVAVGILHKGETYMAGFGVNNVNQPRPVDPDTLFQIGSVTKTVTATAIMWLVEKGKVELNAPVRRYLPDFALKEPKLAEQVTVQHLLMHVAGWMGDFFYDTGRGADALAKYVAMMADLPIVHPLDQGWAYNNAAFGVAGRIIEVVSGESYEHFVSQRILAPLGMEMSFFFPEDVLYYNVAVGHNTQEDGAQELAKPWALARSSNPAGGIVSTVRDQLRYARFHLGDGTTESGQTLLSRASLQEMQKTHRKAASLADEVGISWLIRLVGDTRLVNHSGATNSQYSALVLVPARNFAITILTNGSRGRTLNNVIVKTALERFLKVSQAEPAVMPLTLELARQYRGHYEAALAAIDIEPQGEGVVVHVQPRGGFPDQNTPPPPAPPPAPFYAYAEDLLWAKDGPMLGSKAEFLRNAQGDVYGFHLGGRIYQRAAHPSS